ELGPQELVVIAVKAHAMPQVAPAIASLLGPETVLLPAQNGIPWWFTYRAGGALDGTRIAAAEPDGAMSPRLTRLAELFGAAGIKIETTPRIRDAVWMKLWGNIAFNPVSVLTGATMGRMADDPGVRAVLRAAMLECQQIAERLGALFDRDVEARIEEARYVGDFKTSMLQDYEAGRPVELDALVGAVVELGRRVDIKAPMLEAIAALTRMRATPAG